MTTGPCSCSSPCLGPPLPYTQNVQIQSITDESRSSIRRKNQGPGQGTSLSRQSSLMDDTQEDEVAHFLTPPRSLTATPAPPPPDRLVFTKLNLWIQWINLNVFKLRNLGFLRPRFPNSLVCRSTLMGWACNYSSAKKPLGTKQVFHNLVPVLVVSMRSNKISFITKMHDNCFSSVQILFCFMNKAWTKLKINSLN